MDEGLVLLPSSVGEMTLRLYGALNYSPNSARDLRCAPNGVLAPIFNPNRKIFEARKRETAALGAGEKLVLGHPLAATIGDSARCMQNLEKVLFTGPKTSDCVGSA